MTSNKLTLVGVNFSYGRKKIPNRADDLDQLGTDWARHGLDNAYVSEAVLTIIKLEGTST